MYQCLKCKNVTENEEVLIKGCKDCGNHLFLLVKNNKDIEKAEEIYDELLEKVTEIEEIEEHRKEEPLSESPNAPRKERSFGIETIKEMEPGIYELNLQGLMDDEPIIVLSKKGSYIISLPSVFGQETKIFTEK